MFDREMPLASKRTALDSDSAPAEPAPHGDWRGSEERDRDYRTLSRSVDRAFGRSCFRKEELQELLAGAWLALRSGDEARARTAMATFERTRDMACEEVEEVGSSVISLRTAEMADFLAEAGLFT